MKKSGSSTILVFNSMKRLRVFLLLSTFACSLPLRAEEERANGAKLRLPWDTLKGVLKMDGAEVRLKAEEFQALIRYTSPKKLPDFTMAGGDVVLSRAEFTRLVQSLVPPAPESADAYIPRASYQGQLKKESVSFTATLRLEVPRKPPKPLRVDLFPGHVAFQEILLNGRPALAEVDGGRLFLTVAEAGSHQVSLRFSAPVPESNASQSLTVPIARTPITEWILEIPERNLDIAVTPALHRELSPAGEGTRVRALLPPTDSVTAAWNPLAPDREKGPAQIYAGVDYLLSIQEDALRVKSWVDLEVLQNTVNELTLDLPGGFAVLDVQGEAVKEWQENPGKTATLTIPLKSARKGKMQFEVTLECVLPGEKSTTTFTGVAIRNALRQRGFIGVELNSDVELPAPVTENLEPKDPFRELPVQLTSRSARLVYGYKYVRPPFSLALALSRHDAVNVVESVIERAEGSTFIRPDGKRVHQITYHLMNSTKQFLEVKLPANMDLWSAFVDGAPVKPVRGEGDKVMVPLVRSASAMGNAVPVELVYFEPTPKLKLVGRTPIRIPMPDVMVSRLQWSVTTPPDQTFAYFGKEFESPQPVAPQELSGFKLGNLAPKCSVPGAVDSVEEKKMSGRRQRAMAAPSVEGFEDVMAMEQSARDIKVEFMKAGQSPQAPSPEWDMPEPTSVGGGKSAMAGILPVRVHVPTMGNTSVFTKTLPERNSALTLPLWHWAKGLETALWILGAILAGAVLWLFRWVIFGWVKRVAPYGKPLLKLAGPVSKPSGTLFAAGVLVLACAKAHPLLFFVALLIYSAAAGRWILSLMKPAEGEKP